MTDLHADKVLILDFGSQFTQLIARRVREAKVYSEIHPFDMDPAALRAFRPSAIILSGGPESVTQMNGVRAPPEVFRLNVPVLGICYGMQTMAEQLGGAVQASTKKEFGHATVRARGHSRLLAEIQDETSSEGYGLLHVWMSHGDQVVRMPEGFKLIASSDNAPIAGMADESRGLYALQFHPEVTHTRKGAAILGRFLHDIAGCGLRWTTQNIIDESIREVRSRVGREQVLLALSGGVDSSVVAALLHEAVGDQLTCVFVDNGLLRLHEAD
ncbi:MAG: glutamine-hydrolyzing GMP synthase, partial [Gammaproteobacteria bacterium]|nr:glutamine-hydrolyzing GMP synthase [Gammaproteobacteria bacterium]